MDETEVAHSSTDQLEILYGIVEISSWYMKFL